MRAIHIGKSVHGRAGRASRMRLGHGGGGGSSRYYCPHTNAGVGLRDVFRQEQIPRLPEVRIDPGR